MKENLLITHMMTGIAYSDKSREKDGDYVPLCRLPYALLLPEWQKQRIPEELRHAIEEDIKAVQQFAGKTYQVAGNMSLILGRGLPRVYADCDPGFLTNMKRLAVRYHMTYERMLLLWALYVQQSQASGQSAVLGEFESTLPDPVEALTQKFTTAMPVKRHHLEDIACPYCGNRREIVIQVECYMKVTDAAVESASGEIEWEDHSVTRCTACQFSGPVSDFTFEGLDDFLQAKKATAALP